MNNEHKDYEDFINGETSPVPPHLTQAIFHEIKKSLLPSQSAVFLKLLGIHLFSGALTLIVCPQFGIGPLGGGHGLMAIFMQMGTVACALACGTLFLGTTAIASLFVLSRPEQKAIYKGRLSQFPLIGALSIGALMIAGRITTGAWFIESMQFTLFWLAGGISAALCVFAIRFRREGFSTGLEH